MLSHIQEEHGRIFDLISDLKAKLKGDADPMKVMEKVSGLRGSAYDTYQNGIRILLSGYK